MVCEMRPETLIDLLAGELSEETAVQVEQHLAECERCRSEINALAPITHPFVSEESWQPDAAMADRVLTRARAGGWNATRQAPPAPASWSFLPRLFAWIRQPLPSYAAAGMVLLALAAGFRLGGTASRPADLSRPATAESPSPSLLPAAPAEQQPAGRGRVSLAAGRLEADSSSRQPAGRPRPGAASGASRARRPIAFVAVYTDAMRLATPGVRDSF